MPDYEPPERSVSGRDVVTAWVLYAVIIFATFAFSTIRGSLSTRPPVIVENPVTAIDKYSVGNYTARQYFTTEAAP